MPLSHDELQELRSASQAHRSDGLAENTEFRRKTALRRKLLLTLILLVSAFALFITTTEHWQALLHSPRN